MRGKFRTSHDQHLQPDVDSEEALASPPNVEDMLTAMEDLDRYILSDTKEDPLVKAALIHYQYETISPFYYGSEPIGRILIVLCLIDAGLISRPALYVSQFLNLGVIDYRVVMYEVRMHGDYEGWVRFFVDKVAEAALHASDVLRRIRTLRAKDLARLRKNSSVGKNAMALYELILRHPVVEVGTASRLLGVSWNTASGAKKSLVSAGILRPKDPRAVRGRAFRYERYLEILREGEVKERSEFFGIIPGLERSEEWMIYEPDLDRQRRSPSDG